MIVIDTSALMAIVQGEPEGHECREVIDAHSDLLIAAPNLVEALIVAAGRGIHGEMALLIGDLGLTILPLTHERAYAVVSGYRRWGKGFHPAALNFADSFAYAAAKEHGCPLLYIGDDFAKTDIESALA